MYRQSRTVPGAVLADERDREGPDFVADDQDGLVRAVHDHLTLGVVGIENALARGRIGDRAATGHALGAAWTKHAPMDTILIVNAGSSG